jgi:hypothetical protein
MASTTSPTTGFFSSPRAQRALYWISGIVFVAGIVAIITVYATRGSNSVTPASTLQATHPSRTSNPGASTKNVKASSDALGVARRFLETAVVRKNMAESYNLVGPNLKNGFTLKQWKTGNNTVVPYPANNAKTTALLVKSSHPTSLLLWVSLVPKPGLRSKPQPQQFSIELDKLNGRWLVNSFLPLYQPPVQNGQG